MKNEDTINNETVGKFTVIDYSNPYELKEEDYYTGEMDVITKDYCHVVSSKDDTIEIWKRKCARLCDTIKEIINVCEFFKDTDPTSKASRMIREINRVIENIDNIMNEKKYRGIMADWWSLERKTILRLYMLLDNIDTFSDIFKPDISNYFRYVNDEVKKRHEIIDENTIQSLNERYGGKDDE